FQQAHWVFSRMMRFLLMSVNRSIFSPFGEAVNRVATRAHRLSQRLPLHSAPYAGQPRLLIARQTGRTVVVLKLIETGVAHQRPPALEIVVDAITAAVPSLLILSTRVRT